MKYDIEYVCSLPRKYVVCKVNEQTNERLYWNVKDQAWVGIDATHYPCTLFETFGEAKFLAQRMNPVARAVPIHIDHR